MFKTMFGRKINATSNTPYTVLLNSKLDLTNVYAVLEY